MRSLILVLAVAWAAPAIAAQPFALTIVDDQGAPVPCVNVTTVNQVVWTSDSNGNIAFYEPGVMDQLVYFGTTGPPWEIAPDGFGFRGRRFDITEGGAATLTVEETAPPGPCSINAADSELIATGLPEPGDMFGVTVVDAETGRGVPMVELHTDDQVWVTDSAGRVAIYRPDVLGSTASVSVIAHGYEGPTSTVSFAPGGRITLELDRQIPAERIYRVTGGGIYRDSVLLGESTPLATPNLIGQVFGIDSVHTAVHDGFVHWIWGDTLRPSYPLGHFRTSSATSVLPSDGGLAPDQGVDLTFFTNATGFARPVADVVDQDLVWTSGLVSVPEASGPGTASELIGSYTNVAGDWSRHDAGLLKWNPLTDNFEILISWGPTPLDAEPAGTGFVEGGYVYWTDIEAGGNAFKTVRVPANLTALGDPSTYKDVSPSGSAGHLRDSFATTEVGDHIGSVFWNDHLQRYLRISARPWGTDAFLGETWLSIGDTPMGPWAWATQVVTHDDYSFYNPRQHPEFDEDGGRVVYFEGTYSHTFSNAAVSTPRYNYNQVMYRLDLDTIDVPVPVYADLKTRRNGAETAAAAAFFALDSPGDDSVALHWTAPDCAPRELTADGPGELAFHAMPNESDSPHAIGLYPAEDGDSTTYTVDQPAGAVAIAYVWPNLISAAFPVDEHPAPLVADAGPDLCLDGPATLSVKIAGASIRWTSAALDETGAELTLDTPGLHVVTLHVTLDGRTATDVVAIQIDEPGDDDDAFGDDDDSVTDPEACAGCSQAQPAPTTVLALLVVVCCLTRPRRRVNTKVF